MPWPPAQRAAIAASLRRKGWSQARISAFFHQHGHGRKKKRDHGKEVDALAKHLRSA